VTPWRDAGLAIARRMVEEAVWHDDRCTWTGDDIDQSAPPRPQGRSGPGTPPEGDLVHRPVGADLYGGTSGIAWFLAHAWRAGGDGRVRRAAIGAVRHSLHRTGATPADTGLYTGALGVVMATMSVARLLGEDPETVAISADAGGLVEAVAASCAAGPFPAAADRGGADLIQGDAGRAVGLLVLAGRPGASRALAAGAAAAGERLLAAAERAPEGWSWPAPDPAWPGLCGLGHGASGVAIAFGMLAAATGDGRFAEGALEAERYERAWFDRARGNWPDLRSAPADHPSFWCHGAAGIGAARLLAWRRTGDPTVLAEAAAALDTATAATMRALRQAAGAGAAAPAFAANLSLCHGVSSVAELQCLAAEMTGDGDHLRLGRRLAEWALEGTDVGLGGIACGVPGGGETPGLMLGLAGVGATLLRLADPSALPSPALPVDW
jgi:lantibiotic modifying enzyme